MPPPFYFCTKLNSEWLPANFHSLVNQNPNQSSVVPTAEQLVLSSVNRIVIFRFAEIAVIQIDTIRAISSGPLGGLAPYLMHPPSKQPQGFGAAPRRSHTFVGVTEHSLNAHAPDVAANAACIATENARTLQIDRIFFIYDLSDYLDFAIHSDDPEHPAPCNHTNRLPQTARKLRPAGMQMRPHLIAIPAGEYSFVFVKLIY